MATTPPRLPLRQNAVVTIVVGIAFQILMIVYTLFVGNAHELLGTITLIISGGAIVAFLGLTPKALRANRRWREAMTANAESQARLRALQAMLDPGSTGPASSANDPRRDRDETEAPRPYP